MAQWHIDNEPITGKPAVYIGNKRGAQCKSMVFQCGDLGHMETVVRAANNHEALLNACKIAHDRLLEIENGDQSKSSYEIKKLGDAIANAEAPVI